MVEAAVSSPPRKSSKALLWIVLVLLVGAAGAAGSWFYLGRSAAPAAAAVPRPQPALFHQLDPSFVVNFEAEQMVRFLQVTIEIMTRDPAALEFVRQHEPVVRNDLLMLLSNQKYEVLATQAGKDELRARALEAVRAVAAREGGDPAKLEAVYFTSFVMQ
ncbi:MAG TPA: flagellar basal body-associated FliL family protein [Steroidobacteraceae bacterium]|nr:flagellar basal body-associated FliL family protein [Steroidobacteraceae bacterium]HNS26800.1 flagellar basal body-associated FliL family protein [Steroidobacteraceae bacterium]